MLQPGVFVSSELDDGAPVVDVHNEAIDMSEFLSALLSPGSVVLAVSICYHTD